MKMPQQNAYAKSGLQNFILGDVSRSGDSNEID